MNSNSKVLIMMENMASYGTAPEEGCSLFGVGYVDAFEQLRKTYLLRRFRAGASSEKFIVGPFGSGKTHFLHQFMELARTENCATSKVTLNKDIDFTQTLTVYKEIVNEFRLPYGNGKGITGLIDGSLTSIRSRAAAPELAVILQEAWIKGLEQKDFKLPIYVRVLQAACRALVEENSDLYGAACRWLQGDIEDKKLCDLLGVAPVAKAEQNLFAKKAMHSLFQFIKHAGYQGTVIGFDEAEQGFAVDKKKTERILSKLMADINAIVDLENGAVLFLYAITPDLIERMDSFAALQQRLADPGLHNGFFDGNVYAPVIDLSKRTEMADDLSAIGAKLTDLMYEHFGESMATHKTIILSRIKELAIEIAEEDLSSSNRRTMVKRVCSILLNDCGWEHEETAAGWAEDEV